MSKLMKGITTAILIASVCAVLLQNHRLNVLKAARASETPSVEATSTAMQEQLHQLLLERRSPLESIAETQN